MRNGGSRRVGCLGRLVIGLVVLVALAVAADFVAKSVAENEAASKIQQQGFPKKPAVSIEGFPFLTQVVARNIHEVKLSSKNIPEGPVRISRISAVMTGIHLNSGFTSGTVDRLSGQVLITFGSLAHTIDSRLGPAGALVGSADLTLSAASSDEVKASLNLLVASGSATWRVSRASGQEFDVRLASSSGIPAAALDAISNFRIKIPHLPFGMRIEDVRITPAGVVGEISAHDVSFGN